MIRRTVHVVALVLALALVGLGSASAAPLVPVVPVAPVPVVAASSNIAVGPIPIPALALQVCVNSTCQTAPRVTALTVKVTGAAGLLGTPPVLLPVACASGVGIGVRTVPGSVGTVSGSVVLATAGGGTVIVPISKTVGTTTGLAVSACTV